MIKLEHVKVKGVKADMIKGTVSITLETRLDEQVMDARRDLQILVNDEAPCDVRIEEETIQLPMFGRGRSDPYQVPSAMAEDDGDDLE